MNFYRNFDMGTPAIRAIPAIPEPPNSKLAGIARGLSPITRSLAMLADACEGLPITTDELCAVLGDDKADLDSGELPQQQLRAFAVAIAERLQREAGQTPEGWTQTALCEGCGPVYLLPMERAGDVLSCPWCENRLAGFVQNDDGFLVEARPIPRPDKVRCCDCRHWAPDDFGNGGGAGICELNGPALSERPAFPNVRRWCSVFLARF